MNWYKIAQLEQNWWIRFYEHLSRTARFLCNESGIRIDEASWSSGNDGSQLFFSFKSYFNNKKYYCSIRLEFSERVSGGLWEGHNLVSLTNQDFHNFTRAFWFILVGDQNSRDISKTQLLNKGYLLPNKATPYNIIKSITASILNDRDDDGGGDDDEDITDSPINPNNYVMSPVLK